MNEFDKIWNETMGCGACKVEAEKKMDCEDCISRESVRQLICKNNDKYGYSDRFHEFTEECLQLPLVTPQPKRGKWIEDKSGIYHCSNCNEEAYWDTDYGQQRFNYCPECGSDNREEADE